MAHIAIIPLETGPHSRAYQATAGGKHALGNTAGEALDAIAAQLPEQESGTLVIVQSLRPDRFFDTAQQARLAELMDRWRIARGVGKGLSDSEQAELEGLMDAELAASAARAAWLADVAGR